MTKQDLWNTYCAKNPSFAELDAKVVMTSRGLKKLFDQTWDMAVSHGMSIGAAKNKEKAYDMPEGFEDLFRGFK